MRYLGIDYGTKRVGLALSDEGGVMAFPYKVLKNEKTLVDDIHNICGTENIGAIVIGESLDLSGQPNKLMDSIKLFSNEIHKTTGLPVNFQQEFMTTVEARGRGGKEVNDARQVAKGGQAAAADASAAALILQRYLDKINQK
ncbi:MAG: Holliday junction resolvase RuvX [Candidatus Pacebacteria bacterium]|nr:Holliday junction resolvase RuvX [Candidatus Paceibacterota bacterium]